MRPQSLPVRSVGEEYREEFFYREDWLGDPWREPEPVVLLHGNEESSVEWYAWVPRMAQQYKLIRPDLPGFGHSNVPAGFQYSMSAYSHFVAKVMDRAGVDSAHIIGAKTGGGGVAMQFSADYPGRTRSLVAVAGPSWPREVGKPSQEDRLGTKAPKEMIEYWDALFSKPAHDAAVGFSKALRELDSGDILKRITAPTLIISADRSKYNPVEKVRANQVQIPNSRLVIIRSDANHIAAVNADECVNHTLGFLKETRVG